MKTLTPAITGIALLFTAAAAQDTQAQTIEFNFGNGTLRLDLGPPRLYEEPSYGRHSKRQKYWVCDENTGECRPAHSSQNNVECWNIPNNGPHGGTHRICDDGYDSRYN